VVMTRVSRTNTGVYRVDREVPYVVTINHGILLSSMGGLQQQHWHLHEASAKGRLCLPRKIPSIVPRFIEIKHLEGHEACNSEFIIPCSCRCRG